MISLTSHTAFHERYCPHSKDTKLRHIDGHFQPREKPGRRQSQEHRGGRNRRESQKMNGTKPGAHSFWPSHSMSQCNSLLFKLVGSGLSFAWSWKQKKWLSTLEPTWDLEKPGSRLQPCQLTVYKSQHPQTLVSSSMKLDIIIPVLFTVGEYLEGWRHKSSLKHVIVMYGWDGLTLRTHKFAMCSRNLLVFLGMFE